MSESWFTWGDELLDSGFIVLPNAMMQYQRELELSSQEINVILQVASYYRKSGEMYPSVILIAKLIGVSTRQIRRINQMLIDKGYLKLKERFTDGGRRTSNIWDFSGLILKLRTLMSVRGDTDVIVPPDTDVIVPPDTDVIVPPDTDVTLTKLKKEQTKKTKKLLPNKGEINPVTEVLNGMKAYYGYPDNTDIDPIPNYGKEGKAIKRMLDRGFSIPEILEAWMQKVKSAGQFKSMVYVNEDIKVSPAKSTTSNIHYYRKAFYQKYKEEYNHIPTAIEIDQINSWIEEMEKRGASMDEILNGDPLKMEVPA